MIGGRAQSAEAQGDVGTKDKKSKMTERQKTKDKRQKTKDKRLKIKAKGKKYAA